MVGPGGDDFEQPSACPDGQAFQRVADDRLGPRLVELVDSRSTSLASSSSDAQVAKRPRMSLAVVERMVNSPMASRRRPGRSRPGSRRRDEGSGSSRSMTSMSHW
jgi:hypothetical protein